MGYASFLDLANGVVSLLMKHELVNCFLLKCAHIFFMSLWICGQEVMDALLELIIALVSEFNIVLQLPSFKRMI